MVCKSPVVRRPASFFWDEIDRWLVANLGGLVRELFALFGVTSVARAYSEDLRIRVVRLVEGGTSVRAAAKIFGVSASTSANWVRRWRKEKSVAPNPVRGHRRALLTDHSDRLLKLAKSGSDLTLEEIRASLKKIGVNVSLWTIWSFFNRQNIRLKKKKKRRA